MNRLWRWQAWALFGVLVGGLGWLGDRRWFWAALGPGAQTTGAAAAASAEAEPSPQPVRLIAVGDLMLGTPQRARSLARDPRSPFQAYREVLHEADLTFGNLETPLSHRGSPTPGKSPESLRNRTNFIFRGPPAAAGGLAWAGFDVVSLANNHAMDYGAAALIDTLECLREAEVAAVGGGENLESALAPVLLTRNRQRFAFFALSDILPVASTAGPSTAGIAPARGAWFEKRMPEAIAEARKGADWVLVSVHWGKEKSTDATPRQRRLGHRLIDWGADVVIGHHTHRLGPVEEYRGGLIHYSLGNFIGPRSHGAPAPAWEVRFQPGERPSQQMLSLD